jgi:AAA+ ATPase superfamily predicted ATPase
VFRWLGNVAEAKPRLTVIIGEYPYLSGKNDALSSVIQKIWDSKAMARGNPKIVLCGSLISYMKDLLTSQRPLFGRRTMSMELKPMTLRGTARFFGYPLWRNR